VYLLILFIGQVWRQAAPLYRKKNSMKKLLILSLVLLTFAAQAQTDKSKKSSNDKQAIENLILQYGEAIKAASVEKVLAVFTKDGVLMAPGAPTAAGEDQLKATYQYVFGAIKLDLKFTILEVTVDKDYAIVRSESTGTTTVLSNNQTGPDAYRELFVVKKENGSWKIARYMYNKTK
jgi:uncharacterized protein (TIGR02246 family)